MEEYCSTAEKSQKGKKSRKNSARASRIMSTCVCEEREDTQDQRPTETQNFKSKSGWKGSMKMRG